MTGHNRKTVNKIIKEFTQHGKEIPSERNNPSALTSWHQDIITLLEKDLSYVRISEELQKLGCDLSYSAITRYIRKTQKTNDICIRFHSNPAEEAQVDFGDIGKRYDEHGKLRKAYVFNMRLSYSRKDYFEVVFDQKVDTWINCHINAFRYFGGVPKIIKLDNLKAGVISPSLYEPIYQKQYKRFADHYGFWPSPCRVRQPQEKGKVESGIKYVCNNFFKGREFNNFIELQNELTNWLEYYCNDRVHGTTHKKPSELFVAEEQVALTALPLEAFDMSSWHKRKVGRDCHISLENNYYSVPAKYAGTEVEVSLGSELVKIYLPDNSQEIALHQRATGKGKFVTNRSHYPKGKLYYPESEEYKAKCASEIEELGVHAKEMLEFLQSKRPKDWMKVIKGILALRKLYSDEILAKVLERALHYGVDSYSKIKAIATSRSYNLPLPEIATKIGGEYARIA